MYTNDKDKNMNKKNNKLYNLNKIRKKLENSMICGKYMKLWDIKDINKIGIDNKEVSMYLYGKVRQLTHEEEEITNACVICYVTQACVVLLPCGHVCYCRNCSNDDRINPNQCPVCRADVENSQNVYV